LATNGELKEIKIIIGRAVGFKAYPDAGKDSLFDKLQ
jgi:hypothetical protein